MGTGKTSTALTAFVDASNRFDARRMLVSAPLRVARDVWHAEVQQWAHLHGLTVSRIHGSRQNRLDALKVPADIHTVNRENLAWLFSGYVQEISKNKFKQIRKWPWDWLTLDEAQSYKNQSALCAKAANRIVRYGLVQTVLELTGTPSPNGYRDIWHQLLILDGGSRLGNTEDAFLQRWFNPPPEWGFKHTIKEGAAAEIESLIADIVLSIPDAQAAVPVNQIKVRLAPAIMRHYQKLARESILKLGEGVITAANAGVLGGKLLQLASGAMYTDDRGNYEVLHDAKLDALCEALDELSFSGPVLIGYNFKSDLKRIGERLKRYGGLWAQLNSEESLAAFERGELDYGIIHPASGGHGLNALYKAGARDLIWFGPTNNLEWWLQLIARLAGGHRRREGLRVQVLVAADTIDETYMAMLEGKDMDQVKLMGALIRKGV